MYVLHILYPAYIMARARNFNPSRFFTQSGLCTVWVLSGLVLCTPATYAQDFLPLQIAPWSKDTRNIARVTQARTEVQAGASQTQPSPPSPSARKPEALTPLTPQDYEPLLADLLARDEMLARMVGHHVSPLSSIEEFYAGRVVDPLEQFGYDLFENFSAPSTQARGKQTDGEPSPTPQAALPAGAVQDNFVLSTGDRLNITFRGQRRDQGIYTITTDGLLILDDLPPVSAAGRTIGQLREALAASADSLYNTDIYVSLESVRQVNVLVVGNVRKPGRQTLTVFHTALDALMQAGGIDKNGSLRQIKLVRDGRTTMVDLYGLLIHGSSGMDLALRDGDRLIVPPLGPTIAVAGGVKRPGIYEILPALKGMKHAPEKSSEFLSMQEALDMAGGLVSPGNNRFMKLGLHRNGQETVETITDPFTPALNDGSILMVARADDKRAGLVELVGHTRQPGLHPLSSSKTLAALLSDRSMFGADIYPLIGAIERWDDERMARIFLDFPPILVAQGQYDQELKDGDIVHLFSRSQMMALQKQKFNPASIEPAAGSVDETDIDPADTVTGDPALSAFLAERTISVRGAVRDSGVWPVAAGTTLDSVLAVAGGLSLEANTSNIEVTRTHDASIPDTESSIPFRTAVNMNDTDPKTVAINPGDTVRVKQKFRKAEGQSVTIIGEVNNPGKYDLVPGDTLRDLFARAGGITDQAYPDGTIFSRESERKAEEERFRAAAREMERALATAMHKEKDAPDMTQIAMVQDLAAELRNVEAVGRITVEADPTVLEVQPELDILLEAGDRIYVPRRPLTVRVEGEVLSPAALQFRNGKNPRDYIAEAGGPSHFADQDRAFVLYPDGSAQPLFISAWNHKASMIPPGSTIVVPRDPKPFDFIESAKDVSQILSNLAVTGIFLSDIRDDD